MTQITIPAQVVNGHLQHDANLAELEGQRVMATLKVVPNASANGKNAKTPPSEPDADFDPEPPPWLVVEKDLYFPMTVPEISLGKVDIRIEEGTPCIILPEELPDE